VSGAIRELTSLDSRLIATLRALLLRPGLLTRAYVDGRGGRFIGPLRIFFLANVVYFVARSFVLQSDTFTTTLRTQLWNKPAAGFKTALVDRKLIAEQIDLASLAVRWDAVAIEHGKTLVVLVVPIFALILALVLVQRRRPIVQHLIFATHFVAFVLLALIFYNLVLSQVFRFGRFAHIDLSWLATDSGSSAPLGLLLAVYLAPALRRSYDLGRVPALLLAPLLVLGFLVAVQLYRFALFFSVYFAT
jgi:hypothetical protein